MTKETILSLASLVEVTDQMTYDERLETLYHLIDECNIMKYDELADTIDVMISSIRREIEIDDIGKPMNGQSDD